MEIVKPETRDVAAGHAPTLFVARFLILTNIASWAGLSGLRLGGLAGILANLKTGKATNHDVFTQLGNRLGHQVAHRD